MDYKKIAIILLVMWALVSPLVIRSSEIEAYQKGFYFGVAVGQDYVEQNINKQIATEPLCLQYYSYEDYPNDRKIIMQCTSYVYYKGKEINHITHDFEVKYK